MKTRVMTAVILLPVFLAVLVFCPPWATAIVVAAMAVLAVYELLYTAGLVRHLRLMAESMAAAAAVVFWSCFGCHRIWGAALVFVYLAVLLCELLAGRTELPFSKICVALFAGLVIPYCLGALVRIRTMNNGRFLILAALILAFTSDSGAYMVGRRFGSHKLAPVISPKKTVEGLVGGILSSVACMMIYCGIMALCGFRMDFVSGVIYGVFGSVGSVVGDLTFSVAKRQCGIKDYGKLMPGHGGVLDRFDSMVVVAPLTELLLLITPLIVK